MGKKDSLLAAKLLREKTDYCRAGSGGRGVEVESRGRSGYILWC